MRQDFASLLTDQQRRALLNQGHSRRYRRGEVIMRQGEPGTTLHLLLSGRVNVVVSHPDGREVPLAFRGPGELLGEPSLWGPRARGATVLARDHCRTLVFTSERFRDHVRRAGLEAAVWETVLARQRESDAVRAEQSALCGRRRVAAALLRLVDVLGEPVLPAIGDDGPHGSGGALVAVSLTQQELADHIGLSRTSVALEYTRLKQLGILRVGRNYVAVRDREALAAVASGAE